MNSVEAKGLAAMEADKKKKKKKTKKSKLKAKDLEVKGSKHRDAKAGKSPTERQRKKRKQPSSPVKATGKDIDALFGDMLAKKKQKAIAEEEKKKVEEEKKRKMKEQLEFLERLGRDANFATNDIRPNRYDEDGMPIYTMDQLKIGQGGGTNLCPFDCECCFQ